MNVSDKNGSAAAAASSLVPGTPVPLRKQFDNNSAKATPTAASQNQMSGTKTTRMITA